MSGQNHANVHETAIVSGAAVIPAPGAGHRITIVGLHVSNGAVANIVTLGFSPTNQRVYNLAANGNADIGLMRWEGDANAAFSISTSSADPARCHG